MLKYRMEIIHGKYIFLVNQENQVMARESPDGESALESVFTTYVGFAVKFGKQSHCDKSVELWKTCHQFMFY